MSTYSIHPHLGINKNQTERKDQVLAVHFQYDYRVKNNWGIRFRMGVRFKIKDSKTMRWGVERERSQFEWKVEL